MYFCVGVCACVCVGVCVCVCVCSLGSQLPSSLLILIYISFLMLAFLIFNSEKGKVIFFFFFHFGTTQS